METLQRKLTELGPWFHNFHLPGGLQTAPDHFLGDFPRRKWVQIEPHIPRDLRGWTALDIGCNAGFYSFELANRGAEVLGIDSDEKYLAQARWLVSQFGPALCPQHQPEFQRMQVHELARLNRRFDLILFMGVFYHLRYPTLALDTVAAMTGKLMIFQTLTMDGEEVHIPKPDYDFEERAVFNKPGWPKIAFIENKYSNDETNWWVPNHAAVEAMLRSTGFPRIHRIAHEIYLCTPPSGGVEVNRDWDTHEWRAAVGSVAEKSLKDAS